MSRPADVTAMRSMNDSQRLPPTVSIITPAYNAARFIDQTLESVLRQTFTDFELLVVDDGSTDETAAIVEAFARRDPRIRLSRQRNQGIAVARNTAMAGARGRFFALLDSDDLWFPTYLIEQLDILARHPDIDVLSANAINFGTSFDGEPLLDIADPNRLRYLSLLKLIQAEDSVSILSIFRREVVDAIGGFDISLSRSEDYDFWLRAAVAGFRVAVNPKPLGLYRRRPDSVSADEGLMLDAMRTPLGKVRRTCADRLDVQTAVDRQLARFARRGLLAEARSALLEGDTAVLAARFSALADTTGAMKYRVASWLTVRAPATIWWAYRCKRTFGQLTRPRRRSPRAHSMFVSAHLVRRSGSER
jgi:cellulose synthase/poly-beta-1,6-N-acetylglucosamine synthase-like glycosyltransferase